MRSWNSLRLAPVAFMLLASCGPNGDGNGAEQTPDRAAEMGEMDQRGMEGMGGMENMEGMAGMAGMEPGSGMMDRMRAHMEAMQGQTGEQFQSNLSRHRQMVANMVSQMNREMREMNMPADEEWSSVVEGVREDLRRLPEMTAAELEAVLPEHRARVLRLLDMHREMMAGMRR